MSTLAKAPSVKTKAKNRSTNWATFRVIITEDDAYIRLYAHNIDKNPEQQSPYLDLSYEEFTGTGIDYSSYGQYAEAQALLAPATVKFAGNNTFTKILEHIESDPKLKAELKRLQVFRREFGVAVIKNSDIFTSHPYPLIYSEHADSTVTVLSSHFHNNRAYTSQPILRFDDLTCEWNLRMTTWGSSVFCSAKWNEPEKITEILELLNDPESLCAQLALLDPLVAQKFSESYNKRSAIMNKYNEALPYSFELSDINKVVDPWYKAMGNNAKVDYLRYDELTRKTFDSLGEIRVAVNFTVQFTKTSDTPKRTSTAFKKDPSIVGLIEGLEDIGFETSLYFTQKDPKALIVVYRKNAFKVLDRKTMRTILLSVPHEPKKWLGH